MRPPRPILRIGWAVHKALHRLSGGRLSTNRPNERVGTLFLVSRGRKTGTLRRNGLYFVEDGPAFAVVASNAGEDADPSWWLNLQATPDADVELGARRIPVRARAATVEEETRLWPKLDAGYGEYAAYRRKVTRRVPVVILEPR
jgi:deazaflavin-dependent oxidoreductase (nitroreductase family)